MTGWRAMFERIRSRMLQRRSSAPPAPEPPRHPRNEPPGPGFLHSVRASAAWKHLFGTGPRRRR